LIIGVQCLLAPIPGQEEDDAREATVAKMDFNAMVLRKQRTLY
jgi:hypothetical protein